MAALGSILRKNAATVVAGTLVVVVLVVAAALVYGNPAQTVSGQGSSAGSDGSSAPNSTFTVLVHDGAGQTHEFPLAENGRHAIRTDLGSNTVAIEDGRVWIEDADCPSGDCLRQAPLTAPGPQLICLPHKLWVELVPEGGQGADLDKGAVSPGNSKGEGSESESASGFDTIAR